jgi:hypothetical protein
MKGNNKKREHQVRMNTCHSMRIMRVRCKNRLMMMLCRLYVWSLENEY